MSSEKTKVEGFAVFRRGCMTPTRFAGTRHHANYWRVYKTDVVRAVTVTYTIKRKGQP